MNSSHERYSPEGQRGVTLIEQIMVIVIASVLACIAVPSLWHLLGSNKVRVAQTDLIATLQHARALAVQTGRPTLACPTRDGQRCSAEVLWDGGWLVGFRGQQAAQLDGPPQRNHSNSSTDLTIQSTAGRRLTQFQPDGSAGGNNLTLLICRRGDASHVLGVKVSNVGRVRGYTPTTDEASQCASVR
ncbi:GspH/FimT family pseudopilin [Dyella subtropica]|uniref:GspH/FimT family pseudopilin n=1 Tax=Dyella subtropica TaxID=2992127 RepID=UPI002257407F|nr:GspH/FimT family pseudopilin [Dyella subtropica]